MSDFQETIEQLRPNSDRDSTRELAREVNNIYESGELDEDKREILRDELQDVGRPEIPVVSIPQGDFYQRLADRWVQKGTETDSVEEDPRDTVNLYTIRQDGNDFINKKHREVFSGNAGEIARQSIESFDNTFAPMGEESAPFMKYAAARRNNTKGIDQQEWYDESTDLSGDTFQAFEVYTSEVQYYMKEIFDPEDDTLTMLRGIGEDAVTENGEWENGDLKLTGGCVEHWTTSPTAAANYGDGYVIAAGIPVDDILLANPVNSGTVMNLPESYINRGEETYKAENIYRAEETDALELAEKIVSSV